MVTNSYKRLTLLRLWTGIMDKKNKHKSGYYG